MARIIGCTSTFSVWPGGRGTVVAQCGVVERRVAEKSENRKTITKRSPSMNVITISYHVQVYSLTLTDKS